MMALPPQPHSRASWPSSDDTTMFNMIIIAIGLGVGSYLLWHHYHAEVSLVVMHLMHWEIDVLGHFTNRLAPIDRQMMASSPAGMTLHDLYGILHALGLTLRIPATILIALLAAICAFRAAPSQYKRRFDLNGLVKEQAASFPVTAAYTERALRLVPQGETLRPADYALTPREWAERFALDKYGRFDEARAAAALATQLGPAWHGPVAAEPAARLLFVAFALHLEGERDSALMLLGEASKALGEVRDGLPEGPEHPLLLPDALLARVDAALRDRATFAAAADLAARHAYATPALMTVLNAARKHSGVLAPAQFAWLKLVDRSLWYALSSLGFETEGIGLYLHPNPRAEAAGARDHWAVECLAGAPVLRPSIERALVAIEQSLGGGENKGT